MFPFIQLVDALGRSIVELSGVEFENKAGHGGVQIEAFFISWREPVSRFESRVGDDLTVFD